MLTVTYCSIWMKTNVLSLHSSRETQWNTCIFLKVLQWLSNTPGVGWNQHRSAPWKTLVAKCKRCYPFVPQVFSGLNTSFPFFPSRLVELEEFLPLLPFLYYIIIYYIYLYIHIHSLIYTFIDRIIINMSCVYIYIIYIIWYILYSISEAKMKGSNTRAVHPELAQIMREMLRIGI